MTGLVAGLATVDAQAGVAGGDLAVPGAPGHGGQCSGGVPFLAGAASWVFGTGPGQTGLFRPGLVDGAELLIMAIALVVALRGSGRACAARGPD